MVANCRQAVGIHHGCAKSNEEGGNVKSSPRVRLVDSNATHHHESHRTNEEATRDEVFTPVTVACESENPLQCALENAIAQHYVGNGLLVESLPHTILTTFHPLLHERPHKSTDEVDHQARKADGDERHVDERGVNKGGARDFDLRMTARSPNKRSGSGSSHLRWVTLSALSFLAHGDLLGFAQEHYGQHECPKDDANNDIVVRGAGVVFIHDIRSNLCDDSDRCVSDSLVDPNRDPGVFLAEIVDHDEDGRGPHQCLLHAKENVGCGHNPPIGRVDHHEGHGNGAAPADDNGPLPPDRIARHTGDEVEHCLAHAKEDEIGSSNGKLFGDENKHFSLFFAVGFGLKPGGGGVGLARRRISGHVGRIGGAGN
mmetsp:Transcript_8398/g.13326  ORF Transcript_8398/g.13326 Transcript_8398/m.13326 type:complete len:371 (+) Transcript_8398:832-1944(+)